MAENGIPLRELAQGGGASRTEVLSINTSTFKIATQSFFLFIYACGKYTLKYSTNFVLVKNYCIILLLLYFLQVDNYSANLHLVA